MGELNEREVIIENLGKRQTEDHTEDQLQKISLVIKFK